MSAPLPGRAAARGPVSRVLSCIAGGRPSPAFGVHLLSLVAALAVLGWLGRPLWFFGDEWDFLVNRGGFHQPHLGLWDAHAHTHWSTGPILIYRALFALFGLRHYAPYLGLNLLLHAGIGYLLWRVMRRVGVLPWVATGVVAVFLVLGGGEEDIFWAFQITMNGSVLLGLVHLLLVDRDGPYGRWDLAAAIVAVVALTFSGITIVMIAISTLAVLSRRGWRLAVATAGPPASAYLIWYVVVARHDPNRASRTYTGSGGPIRRTIEFWWTGVSNVPGAVLGASGVAVLLLGALVLWLARRLREKSSASAAGGVGRLGWERSQWPVATLATGVPLLFAMVSLGRADFGPAFAIASRYVYISTAFLLPAVGLLLSEVITRGWLPRIAAAGLLGVIGWHGVTELLVARDVRLAKEVPARGQILAATELLAAGAPTNSLAVEPEYSPELQAPDLTALQRRGDLPPVGKLTADSRLRAAAALQVLITPDPRTTPGAGAVLVQADQASITPATGGCVTVTPEGADPSVVLDWPGPGGITVTSRGGGLLRARLDPPGPLGPSQPRLGDAPAGGPVWLSVVRADRVILDLPENGPSELCHLSR
jgi:hypothetical protein